MESQTNLGCWWPRHSTHGLPCPAESRREELRGGRFQGWMLGGSPPAPVVVGEGVGGAVVGVVVECCASRVAEPLLG